MRKSIYLGTSVLAFVLLVNCKSDRKPSPGEVAKAHTEHLTQGKYDVFVEGIFFDEPRPEHRDQEDMAASLRVDPKPLTKEEKDHYVAAVRRHIEPVINEKGGMQSVSLVSEQTTPDGNSAKASVKTTYKNGDVEHMDYDLVRSDDGWKIRTGGHDREVMRRRTADGKREVMKLKEEEHKEVLKAHEEGDREFLKEKETDNKEVLKTKEDGHREVFKDIERKNEEVIKTREDGKKEVIRIEKETR